MGRKEVEVEAEKGKKKRRRKKERERKKRKRPPLALSPSLTQQDVFGLHVSVHQPGRVHRRDPLGDVPRQAQDPGPGAEATVAATVDGAAAAAAVRRRALLERRGDRAAGAERREDQKVRRQRPRPHEGGDPPLVLLSFSLFSCRARRRRSRCCRGDAGERRDLGAERGAVRRSPKRDAFHRDGDSVTVFVAAVFSFFFFGQKGGRQQRRSDRRVRTLGEEL